MYRSVYVNINGGLHARPAAAIVKIIKKYKSKVYLKKENGTKKEVDSTIGLMSLGVTQGSTIGIYVDGEDEQTVMAELIYFINNYKSERDYV